MILLATQAFVVSASEKDGVAVALYITLADNDVAVAVNLCCIHIHSPYSLKQCKSALRSPSGLQAELFQPYVVRSPVG